MPGESFVNVTEGSGKLLHTYQRLVGSDNVEDEVIIVGEPYLATYGLNVGSISTATASSHLLQIMAGASLRVGIRRIEVYQQTAATAAAIARLFLTRLSTAGTGGSAASPASLDPVDAAAGATGMVLPTVKGTEASTPWGNPALFTQTIPTAGAGLSTQLAVWDFSRLRSKAFWIAAGVANGICIKNLDAVAAAQVMIQVEFVEANFA